MLRAAHSLIQRMSFVSVLLLTLIFAAPAFESHACAEEAASGAQIVASVGTTADPCPDCGPACANGCCHAPHVAIAPDAVGGRAVAVFAAPDAWADVARGPLDRPAGPDRPPRT